MRSFSFVICLLVPALSRADVIMPKAGSDHSLYRVDCEVFGWDKEYTQVAAVCLWVKREPLGRTRGEGLLVVFPVGSVQAIHNVQVKFITQPDMPHNPVPVAYAPDIIDAIDFGYARMWPRRPLKKQPRGAMSVELVWDKVEAEPQVCKAAVGFVLKWKGQLRFQPHQVLDEVKAPCALLRMTENKNYWIKSDLAVGQPRFDYSATKNESSFRYPVSAQWSAAKSIAARVRTSLPSTDARVVKAKQALAKFGKVEVVTDTEVVFSGVSSTNELKILGERVGRELGLARTVAPPQDVMLEVTLAPEKAAEDDDSESLR